MVLTKEVKCPYCHEVFYLKTIRLIDAKVITCLWCNKRFENIGALL